MKNILRQILHARNFMIGFVTIVIILFAVSIYPLFNQGSPLDMIGLGTFFKPGTYISMYDAVETAPTYTLRLDDAAAKRVEAKLPQADRESMKKWLVAYGIPDEAINTDDLNDLLNLWNNTYDPDARPSGLTSAFRKSVARIDAALTGLLESLDVRVYTQEPSTGEMRETAQIKDNQYINVSEVINTRKLWLGTDNFGRDAFKELLAATGVSLKIGLIAGVIATALGLLLGLVSGFVGGIVDDIIMFFANLFTVIPGFVLLILISYSIGQEQRGATVVAAVIGCTSWVWTTRSVRAQTLSLRNRDHVNLSRLSGHSLPRILITDILPYIASYVVMALILQICSGILAEAQLSMLGLGPKTTETPTLGLMMFWGMTYAAHQNGAWWAYFPVILMIALVSFSLNLMNTGLDQVFNPQLRS
ncbi:MAG: ABC transporter permease [Oscillospiraceae bacterium]|jgi:peptide/nickel transport system permease protein|nr:ABC transporter permease [Oscillospiraceae bacterium]